MEKAGLLDMTNRIHKICLILVFFDRIQASLNRTTEAWNHHRIRTEHYRSPVVLFELSRERGLREGWWRHDPGDPVDIAGDEFYGVDGDAPLPPADEIRAECRPPREEGEPEEDEIIDGKMEELEWAHGLLDGKIDLAEDDMNWGINVFSRAVLLLTALVEEHGGMPTSHTDNS